MLWDKSIFIRVKILCALKSSILAAKKVNISFTQYKPLDRYSLQVSFILQTNNRKTNLSHLENTIPHKTMRRIVKVLGEEDNVFPNG